MAHSVSGARRRQSPTQGFCSRGDSTKCRWLSIFVDGRWRASPLVYRKRAGTRLATHGVTMASRTRKRGIVVAVLAEAGSKSALKEIQAELQKGVRKPPLRADRRRSQQNRKARPAN
jgi:hypothetical protein